MKYLLINSGFLEQQEYLEKLSPNAKEQLQLNLQLYLTFC